MDRKEHVLCPQTASFDHYRYMLERKKEPKILKTKQQQQQQTDGRVYWFCSNA